ncbi:hypothetical protein VTN77DRAFT_3872 [Rasamsonia byssochlamydoides]|uniref:uncharacterized protein n=1 Tax=Rasamsonia byssochlamydoides TaxID=89139 RepID=UPI003741F20C
MKQHPANHPIYWIFFPINAGESIQMAWVRHYKSITTEAADPVLVTKIRDGDGVISGFLHDGFDPESTSISEIGVTCDDTQRRTNGRELEPRFDRYDDSPPIPPDRRGSQATAWYMTKAPLEGLLKVRVCQDQEQPHHPYPLGSENFRRDHGSDLRSEWQHGGKL